MKYLGGKHRQGPIIAQYILKCLLIYKKLMVQYIEPFCGAMGVATRVINLIIEHKLKCKIILSDNNQALITTWKSLVFNGWVPPCHITLSTYNKYKKVQDPNDPMTAYVGFGMGFGGKWFGTFTRNRAGRKYDQELVYSTLLKANILLKAYNLKMSCIEYTNYANIRGAVFYLDPPYANRTPQRNIPFDHEQYWSFVRLISKNNVVLLTEYIAPYDFIPIYNFGDTVVRHHASKGKDGTCERIFIHESRKDIIDQLMIL